LSTLQILHNPSLLYSIRARRSPNVSQPLYEVVEANQTYTKCRKHLGSSPKNRGLKISNFLQAWRYRGIWPVPSVGVARLQNHWRCHHHGQLKWQWV